MKSDLERLLREALRSLVPAVLSEAVDPAQVVVERARDTQHGDFQSNIAMRIAKAARKNPRELAQALVAALPKSALVSSAEVAGAGFINFRLAKDAWFTPLKSVAAQGAAYGRSNVGAGRKVMIEFVSANPTGPMHVGHGRGAAYGATLGNLLEATGHSLYREYYINDAGRQIDILAVSVYLRYLELCGESVAFPSNGYRAEYILPVARTRCTRSAAMRSSGPPSDIARGAPPDAPGGDKDKHIDGLIENARRALGAEEFDSIVIFARDAMMADIRNDLEEFGVRFDHWYSERELTHSGAIEKALDALRASGHVYVKDGATWFKSTDFGDDEDRVIIRENGVGTYFAADIAYHFDKRQRGHDLLIDVWGADHHGYVSRVRGALMALGAPGDCFEVTLHAAREPVPRRREAGHGQARRQLRHAARPAQRSRQRRLPLLLPAAQPRPGAGFRSRAGEIPLQRKPRVLHPVRTRARGVGDEAACLEGPHLRRRRSRSVAAHERARAGGAHGRVEVSGDHRARRALHAHRMRWCISCAILRTRCTPTTTPNSSSSRKRPCAMRA